MVILLIKELVRMNYTKSTGFFPSTNGTDNIAYYIYTPKKKSDIRGVIQISHGMCEYIVRYEEFADFLTGKGFVVCGNDHLGHGASVSSEEDLGYFAEDEGWQYLPKDLFRFTRIMKRSFPGKPYILFGHSMGSFIARLYITSYGDELDGAIIAGTSGGEILEKLGLGIAKSIAVVKGERFRSEKLNKLLFGLSNEMIPDHRTDFDWVTRDEEIVDKYVADTKCNFVFTASGFIDLIKLLEKVSDPLWAHLVPKKLPLFLVSGDADPVGNYGKGVEHVYESLNEVGCNVEMRLYEDARHEVLNEINRDEVYSDILAWIEKTLPKKGD